MSDKSDLQEFKADHSGGVGVPGAEVPDPVVPAGGLIKKKLADLHKVVDPKPEKLKTKTPGQSGADLEEDTVVENVDITDAFAAIFEGTDVSEDLIDRFQTIFNAAVHEEATRMAQDLGEDLSNNLEEEIEETIKDTIEDILENLDGYLDYVIEEWMKENEVAIESGIKVEMAESFMSGLKTLFEEHNVDIDESTVDVVSSLESELDEAVTEANKAITENIRLHEELDLLRAEYALREISEGLTTSQAERLRILAEKLDTSNIDRYVDDVISLRESFFKPSRVIQESIYDEDEILTEETRSARVSEDYSVNALAAALSKINK